MSHFNPTAPGQGRWLRRICFFIAVLATGVGLFYAIENWRGARAWTHAQAMVKAKGECLDLSCVLPPPIPTDRNFAQLPAIANAMTLVAPLNRSGTYTQDLSEEAVAARARLHGFIVTEPPRSKNGFSRGHRLNGRLDLEAWRVAQERNTNFAAGVTTNTGAKGLMEMFATQASIMDELSGALEKRPEARYPIHPEDLYAALVPHLGWITAAARSFALRSTVRLATGDAHGAFKDARTAFRLAETLKTECFSVWQLVRFRAHNEALRALGEGLAEHAWSDDQLVEWQALESTPEFKAGLEAALRLERSANCLTLDQLLHQPNLLPALFGDDIRMGISKLPPGLIPTGWWRQNQASVVRFYQPVLDQVATAPHGLLPSASMANGLFYNFVSRSGPYTDLTRPFVPAVSSLLTKANRSIMTSRLAIVACGLERYRLKHGSYPTTLKELETSKLVTSIPLDMDGQPVRYRRTNDEWYNLYSIGPNGRDDGGEFVEVESKPALDWPWPVPVGEGRRMF